MQILSRYKFTFNFQSWYLQIIQQPFEANYWHLYHFLKKQQHAKSQWHYWHSSKTLRLNERAYVWRHQEKRHNWRKPFFVCLKHEAIIIPFEMTVVIVELMILFKQYVTTPRTSYTRLCFPSLCTVGKNMYYFLISFGKHITKWVMITCI